LAPLLLDPIMERVRDAGAGFRSITEVVDTTTSAGRMVMQMLGSFADDAERAIMQSHTAEVAVWPAVS
jgi:DNA invertase Pin-like site-specific DNA recombinase